MVLNIRRRSPFAGCPLASVIPADIVLSAFLAPGRELYCLHGTKTACIRCGKLIFHLLAVSIYGSDLHIPLHCFHIHTRRRSSEGHDTISACHVDMDRIITCCIPMVRRIYRHLVVAVALLLRRVPMDIALIGSTPHRYMNLFDTR